MEIEINRMPFVAGAGKYAKRLGQHGFVAVLSGAVGLSACLAQTLESPQVAASSPAEVQAPGLAYTPEQMLQRLVQLAEGPIPTRAELEKEFGFEFKLRSTKWGGDSYLGKAAYPFESNSEFKRENFTYYEITDGQSLVIGFESNCLGRIPKYCLQTEKLIKKLDSKWLRHSTPYSHFSPRIFYTVTLQGIPRKLEFAPNSVHGDSCMHFFLLSTSPKKSIKAIKNDNSEVYRV